MMKLLCGLFLAIGLAGGCESGDLSLAKYILWSLVALYLIIDGGKKYVYIP